MAFRRSGVAAAASVGAAAGRRAAREGGARAARGNDNQRRGDRPRAVHGVASINAALTTDGLPSVSVQAGINVAVTPGISPVGMLAWPA